MASIKHMLYGALRGAADVAVPAALAQHEARIQAKRDAVLAQMQAQYRGGFELSPGQTRYDASGNVVASLPADTVRTLTADEIEARGLPEGGVYQVDPTGKILAPVKPRAPRQGAKTGMVVEDAEGNPVVNEAFLEGFERKEQIAARHRKPGRTGPTDAQAAANEEIDAARGFIGEMSREEIVQKTRKTSDTGRENPDFDPNLEGLVNKALQRKVGVPDPEYSELFKRLRRPASSSPPVAPPLDVGKLGMDEEILPVVMTGRRVSGRVYQTPQGPMRWIQNGAQSGWLPVQQ